MRNLDEMCNKSLPVTCGFVIKVFMNIIGLCLIINIAG